MSCGEMYRANYTQLYNYYKNQVKYHYEQYIKYLYYLKYYQWQMYMHYKKTSNEMHKNASTEMEINYDQQSSHFCSRSSFSSATTAKRQKRCSTKCRKVNRKMEQGKNWKKIPKQNILVYENAEFDDEEEELELDVGFQNFLKQSAQFRKKRDQEKKLELHESAHVVEVPFESVEYVDVLRKGPDGTDLPPTAVNRKLLYERKYDSKGTTILSLETALQWKFNKFIDQHSPKLWPAIPLKF